MTETRRPRPGKDVAPARLLAMTTAIVMAAEAAFMLLSGSPLQDILVDSVIVGVLVGGIGYVLMARPLAEAESQLLNSEQRLRDFTDAASDWQWESDDQHRITFVSDHFTRATGLDVSLTYGKKRWEFAAPNDASDWDGHQAQLNARRPFRDFEYALADNTGTTRWIRISGIPVAGPDGTFRGYRGTGVDFTVEKNATLALERTNAQLKGVLDTSLDGFVIANASRDADGFVHDFIVTRVNARAALYLGRPANVLKGKALRAQLPGLLDDDLFYCCARTIDTGTPFDCEQSLWRDGDESILRFIGVKLEDGLVMTLSDVTRERQAGRQARLAATIFETAGEAMMMTDVQRRIIAVNPTFTEITGYAPAEVIGNTPRILASGHHDRAFYDQMTASLHASGRWQGEVWNRHKDGHIYVQRLVISTVRDADDSISHYVGVFADITDEKRMNEQLAFHAHHDPLTGLPNRLLLADRVERAIQFAIRDQGGVALFFIDLDGFKPVNDRHGHMIGDEVLKVVAERLNQAIRESDTVARIGGDEFVVLSMGVRTPEEAQALAGKLIDAVSAPITVGDAILDVGASIGIAHYPANGDCFARLIDAADQAMYEAKRAGKSAWRLAPSG